MWNLETGADTKYPAMKPMCQIQFYNQLPTSDTILKWTLVSEVGQFHMVASTMWNPDTGADTKYLAMKPMCQIMFYNQLATSDIIHKWTLAPEVGRLHNKCPAMEPMCQIMFYNQLPTSDTIHKWTMAPEVGWFHIGVDTKCPAMELMCSIMLYNQLPTSDTNDKWTLAPEVGRFHNSALTDVKPLHWGRHQVSGYETDVSNHVL